MIEIKQLIRHSGGYPFVLVVLVPASGRNDFQFEVSRGSTFEVLTDGPPRGHLLIQYVSTRYVSRFLDSKMTSNRNDIDHSR